jgi:putative aminopeptidase FrvX
MDNTQINRFKNLLSVQTKTYKEDLMIDYICNFLDTVDGVEYFLDSHNNIYVTKGKLQENEYYPLFIAHTDTVHDIVDEIVVKEEYLKKPPTFGRTFSEKQFLCLKGYRPNGMPTGIGGDDKCGIFIGLELLNILPTVKVAFFVSEETGCHGSKHCNLDFLNDVGYAIQFDAPANHLITEYCSGVQLFERNGEFIKKLVPIFENIMGVSPELQSHPYTDISQIKKKSDFCCINFSCGYYNMHSNEEFVVIDDVSNAILMAQNIVKELSLVRYDFNSDKDEYDFFTENYKKNDNVILSDNNNIYLFDDRIEIESTITGEMVILDINEILDLYDGIKKWILTNSFH